MRNIYIYTLLLELGRVWLFLSGAGCYLNIIAGVRYPSGYPALAAGFFAGFSSKYGLQQQRSYQSLKKMYSNLKLRRLRRIGE